MTYQYLQLAGLSLGVANDRPAFSQFLPRVTVREIQHVVAEYYEISEHHMSSDWRARSVARPRQVAMFLSREMTKMSFPELARRFGKGDHTTVIHAVREVQKRMDADPIYALDVKNLRERLAR